MTITHVYVAGPFGAGGVDNVRNAIEAGAKLQAAGFVPFVPHLSWLADLVCPQPYEAWLAYDLRWLARCDALLRLPGESPGADREIDEAMKLGLVVHRGTVERFIEKYGTNEPISSTN